MPLPRSVRPDAPKVFLCYADANQGTADRLHMELIAHGVRTFRPQRDTLPGDQIVHTIEKHIKESDYFLLLWSGACAGQSWLRDQWHSTLKENGGFLFVLRLDTTEVPPLLAARRQFNAFDGWDAAVTALADCWKSDRALGHSVLPAPGPAGRMDQPTTTLYIRNRALDVSHVLVVPVTATGAQLRAQVRTALALGDEVSDFNGKLGLRLSYDLLKDERSIPDLPLNRMGLADGSVIDLEITIRYFAPDGERTPVVYRRDPDFDLPGMRPATRRSLYQKAFGHLIPRRNRTP
ncbi:toll/interleukin-1 receptor domain-containing protein [Actinomadura rubrisoli]|uniref:Toll/interleukin-1 receptor domain-containing protein n=1 Tax=Actinomadura rubrisoli TaxID=2530368 RepID=A0A4R5CA36_9ACTN|nr:toll/interleukin-1 receptor domain-containing protein [Actinomadura rubrisoli]TDD93944.1 toll/interleukin-1 receptor domain-containing protein [Actinomadura rubrisoli]